MDEKTLLALFDRFEKSSAVELKYSGNGNTFELRRKEAFSGSAPAAFAPAAATEPARGVAASSAATPEIATAISAHTASPAPHVPVTGAAPGNEYIKSPIVGTFYRAASPDTPPFAEVGKKVLKGQKLCIIEAMKMMNALEAEFDCEIVKLLVNNGDMVEFDQNIFEVRAL